MNNPIIDEIREARAALAAEHGYDLVRINDWARQQTVARQARHQPMANKGAAPELPHSASFSKGETAAGAAG